jgi:DNA-binding HxlR family transcriptional regulator
MKIEDHNTCGVTKTIKLIGSKWSMLILHNLFDGKKRFGEIQRSLKGISPKTLSLRLKELEQQGFVTKKVFPVVPLHVEYHLTDKGRTLKDIFSKMRDWGERSS